MDNVKDAKTANGKRKALWWVIGIAATCLALFIAYKVVYGINSSPSAPSSVRKNCEIVHNIYSQEKKTDWSFKSKYLMDWYDYRNGTLYNFGLCASKYDKQWNGTWIITEEFIREYVKTYSAGEFFSIYTAYIAKYIENYSEDRSFYAQNPELLSNITKTSTLLLELTDLFDVVEYRPSTDQIISKSSETEEISGQFNVGSDNHIEVRSTTLTTDTYEYDGYTVIHRHGQVYHEGVYGWYNGVYRDVKPYFESVNDYRLFVDGWCIMDPADSLAGLDCRWIETGEGKYYEHIIDGRYVYFSSNSTGAVIFDTESSSPTTPATPISPTAGSSNG